MLSLLSRLIDWFKGLFRSLSSETKRKAIEAIVSILREYFREYYRQEKQQKGSRPV